MVVEPASAMQLAGYNFYKLEDCNHTEVCKPVDKEHPSYSILVEVIRNSRQGTEPEPQEVLREYHAQASEIHLCLCIFFLGYFCFQLLRQVGGWVGWVCVCVCVFETFL